MGDAVCGCKIHLIFTLWLGSVTLAKCHFPKGSYVYQAISFVNYCERKKSGALYNPYPAGSMYGIYLYVLYLNFQ